MTPEPGRRFNQTKVSTTPWYQSEPRLLVSPGLCSSVMVMRPYIARLLSDVVCVAGNNQHDASIDSHQGQLWRLCSPMRQFGRVGDRAAGGRHSRPVTGSDGTETVRIDICPGLLLVMPASSPAYIALELPAIWLNRPAPRQLHFTSARLNPRVMASPVCRCDSRIPRARFRKRSE